MLQNPIIPSKIKDRSGFWNRVFFVPILLFGLTKNLKLKVTRSTTAATIKKWTYMDISKLNSHSKPTKAPENLTNSTCHERGHDGSLKFSCRRLGYFEWYIWQIEESKTNNPRANCQDFELIPKFAKPKHTLKLKVECDDHQNESN
jgi:hypothetical protein